MPFSSHSACAIFFSFRLCHLSTYSTCAIFYLFPLVPFLFLSPFMPFLILFQMCHFHLISFLSFLSLIPLVTFLLAFRMYHFSSCSACAIFTSRSARVILTSHFTCDIFLPKFHQMVKQYTGHSHWELHYETIPGLGFFFFITLIFMTDHFTSSTGIMWPAAWWRHRQLNQFPTTRLVKRMVKSPSRLKIRPVKGHMEPLVESMTI